MKKSLFFVAAAALALTACTSEDDLVQTGKQKVVENQAVGFDVYTPAATDVTRAGYEGVMSTTRLQGVANGFGLYGYYTDQTNATVRAYPHTTGDDATNDYVPNFMSNQQVTWNNTNKGWQYEPLKYWPNETQQDAQSNPDPAIMDGSNSLLDKLTFFAYAPYVDPADPGFVNTEGIRAITANTGKLTTLGVAATRAAADPAVEYKTAASAVNSVDLLWGVAPTGGLHYTGVNGNSYGANTGLPYIDLAKPDVNTSLKFFFQHALARFGFTIASAIDQVPQGGTWVGDNHTRITVDQVKLTGYFATEGILNLNNTHENAARWISMNGTDLEASSAVGTAPLDTRTITIEEDIDDDIQDPGTAAGAIAINGVTTSKKDLIMGKYTQVDDPTTFVAGDKYYNNTGTELYATCNKAGIYVLVGNDYMKLDDSEYYGAGTYHTLTPSVEITSDPGSGDYVYKLVTNDYIRVAYSPSLDWGTSHYYTLTPAPATVATSDFSWPDVNYYKPERSFFMVIPTNNVPNICTTGVVSSADLEKLRTVWVTITYYVTTEDANLQGGYSRVKNVIQKKVVLPSLDNGKSYNLHLLLGLTSVKVEAEVGDWKEVYVQTDLPQNTPGE